MLDKTMREAPKLSALGGYHGSLTRNRATVKNTIDCVSGEVIDSNPMRVLESAAIGQRARVWMLDLREVRERRELIQQRLAQRGQDYDLDGLLTLDEERRQLSGRVEQLKHSRNVASEEIARLKSRNQPADRLLTEMKSVADEIRKLDDQLRVLDDRVRERLLLIPNVPHESVPVGRDENENREVRRWGDPPAVGFRPRPHWEIGEALGILDWERGARIAGARFCVGRGWGARLERALINFMLDLHTREHGYLEVLTPFLANRDSLTATGQLPKFEEDLFHLRDPDYFLIPTAEVPITNLHRGEILTEDVLPLAYVGYSPCFRREAGAYGKDTRGLIRQHQFNKVELVRFVAPESSYPELERLVQAAEEVLRRLGLHYRVVALSTGDMGFAAAKTYDIEVWFPAQGAFREISSCSNFEGFQSRRGQIRFRRRDSKKVDWVHTLNGSGLAVGRTLAAVIENYQQADGSVLIPEVLRSYVGGAERISP